MKVRIEIDTKTFVRFWLVVIGFGLAGLMIYSAREALVILGTALFLALALNGPVVKLASYLPGKSRLGGTALAFTSIILILGAVIWFVVPPLVQQSAKFAETIPSLVSRAGDQWAGLREFIDRNNLQPQVDTALESIKQESASWAANVGSNLINSVGSLASFLISLFLVLVLAFLMLLEGPEWMRRIWGLYRDKARMARHQKIVHKMHSVLTGYITGQLTVSAIGAIFAGLCVFIISLFFPVVPGDLAMPTILITFILTLIPMFGSTLAGVTVGILLLFNSVTAAIIYVVYFFVYQQIENNFISPVIQSKRVELSALAVLAAVTVGLYVGGLAGAVLAVPAAGSIKVLLEYYLERSSHNKQALDEKPLRKFIKKIRPTERSIDEA